MTRTGKVFLVVILVIVLLFFLLKFVSMPEFFVNVLTIGSGVMFGVSLHALISESI